MVITNHQTSYPIITERICQSQLNPSQLNSSLSQDLLREEEASEKFYDRRVSENHTKLALVHRRRYLSLIMASSRPKMVRFEALPQYRVICNNFTPKEIESYWWTSSEIRATKRVCQRMAKESRKIWCLSECVDGLHKLTTTSKHGKQVESTLIETTIAKRLVSCSSKVIVLRGLEYQICDQLRQHRDCFRARICRMQRAPNVSAEHLSRISQKYSNFDRIVARLLGEADALYQAEDCKQCDRGGVAYTISQCRANSHVIC